MASQEEVLEAIQDLGGSTDIKALKNYFQITANGSSWLPQRLRALLNKELVYTTQINNTKHYCINTDFVIYVDRGGRPKGSVRYDYWILNRLLELFKQYKCLSFADVRRLMYRSYRWGSLETAKYLNKLRRDGLIFKNYRYYSLYKLD